MVADHLRPGYAPAMELDLIDVFANGSLSGNPLAVVRGGDALTTAQMLALTRWLGFSETTFLLPPSDPAADYHVRIFYPAGELPFAGHPTLGSAAAWLAAGGVPARHGVAVQRVNLARGGLVRPRPARHDPHLVNAAARGNGARNVDVAAGHWIEATAEDSHVHCFLRRARARRLRISGSGSRRRSSSSSSSRSSRSRSHGKCPHRWHGCQLRLRGHGGGCHCRGRRRGRRRGRLRRGHQRDCSEARARLRNGEAVAG